MIVTCTNPDCKKEYDIDPAKIPPGKKGFKCNACGGMVSLDAAPEEKAAPPPAEAEKIGVSKAFLLILAAAILAGAAAIGYFYMQIKALNEGGIAITGEQRPLSESRVNELRDKLKRGQ